MRKIVLTAAALTVSEPRDMQEVRLAASKERMASEGSEALRARILELEELNAKLEAELATAKILHASTRHEFEAFKERGGDVDEADAANDEAAEGKPPTKGEVRYYKKTGTGGGTDRMVPRKKPCNHNSWTAAFAGDQAEKGIAKLEGQRDWKSLWKCGGCTNGGFWKVAW